MSADEEGSRRPPGFAPPKDIDVPWYAWVLFPAILIGILAVLALILGKLLPLMN